MARNLHIDFNRAFNYIELSLYNCNSLRNDAFITKMRNGMIDFFQHFALNDICELFKEVVSFDYEGYNFRVLTRRSLGDVFNIEGLCSDFHERCVADYGSDEYEISKVSIRLNVSDDLVASDDYGKFQRYMIDDVLKGKLCVWN